MKTIYILTSFLSIFSLTTTFSFASLVQAESPIQKQNATQFYPDRTLSTGYDGNPSSSRMTNKPLGFTVRQEIILQTISGTDGFINEELHQEFWKDMPLELKNNKQLQKVCRLALSDIMDSWFSAFQREIYVCAKLSLQGGKIVKTARYEELCSSMRSSDMARTPELKNLLKTSDQIITAAVSKKPIYASGGVAYITEEVIDKALEEMDGKLERMKRLLDPVWREQETQRYD